MNFFARESEIIEAIELKKQFDMEPNNDAGPNGFPTLFYQK